MRLLLCALLLSAFAQAGNEAHDPHTLKTRQDFKDAPPATADDLDGKWKCSWRYAVSPHFGSGKFKITFSRDSKKIGTKIAFNFLSFYWAKDRVLEIERNGEGMQMEGIISVQDQAGIYHFTANFRKQSEGDLLAELRTTYAVTSGQDASLVSPANGSYAYWRCTPQHSKKRSSTGHDRL